MIGIYRIVIGEFNYVGSSKDLESREKMHFNLLVNNKHENKEMQEAFNKNMGARYEILKTLNTPNTLESWENYYIGLYNAMECGFNKGLASKDKNITVRPTISVPLKKIKILTPEEFCEFFSLKKVDYIYLVEKGMPVYKITKILLG